MCFRHVFFHISQRFHFSAPLWKAGKTLPFVLEKMNRAALLVFPGLTPVYDIDKTKVKERTK